MKGKKMHGRARKLAEIAAPVRELLNSGKDISQTYEFIPELVARTGSPADARRTLLAALMLLDMDIHREARR